MNMIYWTSTKRRRRLNQIVRESLLFDLYGSLLTEKKRIVMELYHEENMSLAEIAEEFGISRAAVHDSLKSAEKQLSKYEDKLGMVKRLDGMNKSCEALKVKLQEIEALQINDLRLEEKLSEVQEIVAELENNS